MPGSRLDHVCRGRARPRTRDVPEPPFSAPASLSVCLAASQEASGQGRGCECVWRGRPTSPVNKGVWVEIQ